MELGAREKALYFFLGEMLEDFKAHGFSPSGKQDSAARFLEQKKLMSFLALCVKMREQTLRDLLRVAGVLNREDEKQSKEGESLEEYLFEAHRNVENLETIRAWAIKDLDGKVSLVHCISEFECSAEGIDNFLPNNLAHWGKRITLVISEMRLDADTRKRVEDAKKSRLRRSNNPED